jgi:hypothetical protein
MRGFHRAARKGMVIRISGPCSRSRQPKLEKYMDKIEAMAGPEVSYDATDGENPDSLSASALAPVPPRRVAKVVRRSRDQRIKRRRGMIRAAAPWLTPSDLLVVPNALSRLMIMSSDIYDKLKRQGFFDENGDPRPAVETLRKLALAEARLASALGLTVSSRQEAQNGSVNVPLDAEFEARVTRIHTERHADASDGHDDE